MTPRRVVAVRLDRVGDLILTTPALALLRRRFPDARITAVVRPYTREVLEGNRAVDEIVTTDETSVPGLFRLGWGLRSGRFDLAVVFSPHTESYALAFATGASRRVGYTYESRTFTRLAGGWLLTDWVGRPEDQRTLDREDRPIPHEIEQNAALVAALDPSVPVSGEPLPDLVLPVGSADRADAAELLARNGIGPSTRLLGLHLAVRWRPAFPGDSLGSLAAALAASWGGPCLLTAGPAEREWLAELRPTLARAGIVVADHLTIKRWGALLERCRVLVSPDTGSLHVASAMKVPTVAVMEERHFAYHRQRWAPWRVPHAIVKKPAALQLDAFADTLQSAVRRLDQSLVVPAGGAR